MKYPLTCPDCDVTLYCEDLTRAQLYHGLSVYKQSVPSGPSCAGFVSHDGSLVWCSCHGCAPANTIDAPVRCLECRAVLTPVLTLVYL